MSLINNYLVLHQLSGDFVLNIKFFCVFGYKGNVVIIVTKDDKVYAFRNNFEGCLELGCATLKISYKYYYSARLGFGYLTISVISSNILVTD
jgi:hypothetical protein